MARTRGGRLWGGVWLVCALGGASCGCQASFSLGTRAPQGGPAGPIMAYRMPDGSTVRSGGVARVAYPSPDGNGVVVADPSQPGAVLMAPAGAGPGCGGAGEGGAGGGPAPHEKEMTTHPAYVIEPPDILFIDAIRVVPKPPYRIEPLDVLLIQVAETLPGQPINGPYSVGPDGTVNLGFSYGTVRIAGLTLEQAAAVIRNQLAQKIREPQVAVALAQFRGVQQTRGEHLVGQDGTITLGTYGCVNVAGLTLCQAKAVIERHLSKWLLNPEISLSVAAYNSKVYYIIVDGGGFGQQVFRFPITGNDTVLDALSLINGLPPIASKKKIWLARPAPCECKGCYQILPINWEAIVMAGDTCTNYQLFPGDRIYIKANALLAFNNYLGQVLAPIEQIFGAVLLGASTIGTIEELKFISKGNGIGFFP
jgi:polysaccharide export outer membrane protein